MPILAKFIFFLIISQPILDMTTSIMTILNMPITVGAIFRALLIVFLFIWINRYFINNKNNELFFIWLGSNIIIVITFIINFFIKEPFFIFAELNFSLKTTYFIFLTFLILIAIKEQFYMSKIIASAIPIVSIIIGTTFWFAFFTKTNISSYTYDKSGYSGWFYAANELSAMLLILLGLTIIHLHEAHENKRHIHFLAIILLLSMLPMVGTKTAFIGGLIIITFYSFYLLFLQKKHRLCSHLKWSFLIIYLLFIVFVPLTPIFKNTSEQQLSDDKLNEQKFISDQQQGTHPLLKRLISSRDIYFQDTATDFYQSSIKRQLFGLGYGGDYEVAPKLIEMDFFDLLFSYGYIGFFILIIPFVRVIYQSFSAKNGIIKFTLLLTIFLILGISFLAGHVLFAPSVMTYFSLLLIKVNQIDDKNLGEQL